MVDLRSQPLDHAVDLSNLLLGVAQIIPVSACGDLQLLILESRGREGGAYGLSHGNGDLTNQSGISHTWSYWLLPERF